MSSVLLLCGCKFFFRSGPAWSLVVKLVKLSLNNLSRVFLLLDLLYESGESFLDFG